MGLLNQILGTARRSTATRGTTRSTRPMRGRGTTGRTTRGAGAPAAGGLVGGVLRSLRGRRRI